MSWWWDSYIDLHNLWSEYAGLSRFAASMNFNVQHLAFKTLTAGYRDTSPEEQVQCMVRCIYAGEHCALWLKNDGYQWWLVNEGTPPKTITPFSQAVPDLAPGRYSVTWYDPQSGQFLGKTSEAVVKEDGVLSLSVPSFTKDLACLVVRNRR